MNLNQVEPGRMFGWKSDGIIDKLMLNQETGPVDVLKYHSSWNAIYFVHVPSGTIQYKNMSEFNPWGYGQNQEQYKVIVKE